MEHIKDLKSTAKEAKIRFKRGFWKEYIINKELHIQEAKDRGVSEQEAVKIQTDKARRQIKLQFDEQTEDDILYEKVIAILSSDEIILNPIKRLIDEDEYNPLNDDEKQRYILDLTEKFNELKNRFEREKILS